MCLSPYFFASCQYIIPVFRVPMDDSGGWGTEKATCTAEIYNPHEDIRFFRTRFFRTRLLAKAKLPILPIFNPIFTFFSFISTELLK